MGYNSLQICIASEMKYSGFLECKHSQDIVSESRGHRLDRGRDA